MTRRVVPLLALVLAFSAAGCGGDSESSSSAPADASTTEVSVTQPAVTESAETDPATTDAPESSDPPSTDSDVPPTGGIEIDDDPVCQAFSRVFAASFFQGLAGAFGAQDGAVEKIELYFAPALVPAVAVIRGQGAAEFQAFPTLARVDAGVAALAAGGFSDDEIALLAATGDDTIDSVLAGGQPDLESVAPAPDAEAKLDAATAAFLADVGTIDEFFEASADPEAEAAFTEALPTQCPKLTASFDSL